MNKKLNFLALALVAFTASLQAQFIPGPRIQSAFTNLSNLPFQLPGIGVGNGVTNVDTTCAVAIALGNNGFGITMNQGSTNTLATTNGTAIVWEFSGDGVNWATNNRLTTVFCPLGNTYAPCYTNIPTSVNNVLNSTFVRVRQIVNTNSEAMWITNLNLSIR